MRHKTALSSCLALPLFIAFACSSESSGGGDGGSAGDAGVDQPSSTYGQSACAACATQACSSENAACASEPECAAAAACRDACGLAPNGAADPTCVAACTPPSASAAAKAWQAEEACRTTGAAASCTACGFSPADGGTTNPILKPQNCSPASGPTCSECFDAKCCELQTKCLGNPTCANIAKCFSGCQDWQCEKDCYQDVAATTDFARYYGCVAIYCPGTDANCTQPKSDCLKCMVSETCKTQYADCHNDFDCYSILSCSLYCSAAVDVEQCLLDCHSANPAGSTLFGALQACFIDKCPGCS